MQTWSGRGKQPRWIGSQLQAGRRLDDFLIDRVANANKAGLVSCYVATLVRVGGNALNRPL